MSVEKLASPSAIFWMTVPSLEFRSV